jgi:hypothetical protein
MKILICFANKRNVLSFWVKATTGTVFSLSGLASGAASPTSFALDGAAIGEEWTFITGTYEVPTCIAESIEIEVTFPSDSPEATIFFDDFRQPTTGCP